MREAETGLFWELARVLRVARAINDRAVVAETLADLDLIREMTDSELLRSRCRDLTGPQTPTLAARQ